MLASPLKTLRSTAQRQWAGQSSLLANAGALAVANLMTAALGFLYWWLAAREFSAREVGLAAAAVSIMNLLAQIGEFGLGPLLISELHGRAKSAGQLISAALAATVAFSAALGVIYLVASRYVSFDLGGIVDTPAHQAIFLVGVAATGFTVVLDQAFVGLLKSGLQLIRSVSFAIFKLSLLATIAFASVGSAKEDAIFATWVIGSLLSLLALAAYCLRQRRRIWHPPNVALLRPIFSSMLGHHAINVSLQAPTLILPYLVAVLLSPQVNAPFYAAWTLINVVLLVPASLSAVVVSVGRREPAQSPRRLRFSLGLSALVVFPAALFFQLFSSFILGLFNAHYPALAGDSLALLGFGTIGMAIKYHFITVQRLANRMAGAAALLAVGGVAEVGAAWLGGHGGGLDGLTKGWLLAVTVEALVMLPVIVGAIVPRAPHRDRLATHVST